MRVCVCVCVFHCLHVAVAVVVTGQLPEQHGIRGWHKTIKRPMYASPRASLWVETNQSIHEWHAPINYSYQWCLIAPMRMFGCVFGVRMPMIDMFVAPVCLSVVISNVLLAFGFWLCHVCWGYLQGIWPTCVSAGWTRWLDVCNSFYVIAIVNARIRAYVVINTYSTLHIPSMAPIKKGSLYAGKQTIPSRSSQGAVFVHAERYLDACCWIYLIHEHFKDAKSCVE